MRGHYPVGTNLARGLSRRLGGPLDRIILVGMFEHVGINHCDIFFKRCDELMTEDGVMVLHSIGRLRPQHREP
jgi:cyclopropane fatty-acyl-phospholipid synthase-like methyltransferase